MTQGNKGDKMIENVEELKSQMDIVEVIGTFIPLKKAGSNFSACCPFHDEKTSSFMVNPKKQFYHCFGCNASGDAIKFVQEYKHLDFESALREIAHSYNLQIKENSRYQSLNPYFESLESLNHLFKSELLKENETIAKVRKYLHNRGLSDEDFNRYDIGLIPNYKVSLTYANYLQELGLIYHNGILANPFRISFALRNKSGKVVAFSCRTHPYGNFKNASKYINSRDSKIFHKSQLLYNFHRAREPIYKDKAVMITEGFMDAIALDKLGVKNAVATCGTAFSASHLSAMIALRTEVIIKLCFDKDKAGESASFRACELLFKNKIFNACVLSLENPCKDIGEVLQEGLELKLKEMSAFAWYCKSRFANAKDAKEKEDLSRYLKAILENVDFYTKEELTKTAISVLGLPSDYFSQKNAQTIKRDRITLNTKQLFKSILNDKELRLLAQEYLRGDELGELKEDFLKLLENHSLTPKAQEILLDESISTLNYKEFQNALVEILKQNTRTLLESARARGEISEVIAFSKRLAELNACANVPF